MLVIPDHWDELWGADGTRCSYQILIGSDIYTGEEDIEEGSLKIVRPMFSAQSPIGNTPCFSMECCLRQKSASIPKGSWLKLEIRLENTQTHTDWVSLGEFKIYQRQRYRDGWVKFTCRDKMQMSNQSYLGDNPVLEETWPKPMKKVLEESSNRIGLTLDPRSKIKEGSSWMVPTPVGLSIRSVWSSIAAAHGGNFIVTPKQTLLLTYPKAQSVEPGILGDTFLLGESLLGDPRAFRKAALLGVDFILGKSLLGGYKFPVETEISEEGYELLGSTARINRVSLSVNDLSFYSGVSGDNDISAECYYASSESAAYAKSQLNGSLYQPLKASDIVFNPLAEIQDSYLVDGFSVVWSELTTTYGIIPVSEGIAEAMSEPANEYGFEDTPLNHLKGAMLNAISKEMDSLDQENLFNRLTNNGEAQGIYIHKGQIYINASYLAAGTLNANLIKSGVLSSKDKRFVLDLDTGEFSITGVASKTDIQALKQEGVERIVTPVMKYSMSDDGLRIQKPGEEIGNKMTHEGMEVSRGSEPMLRADKDGVIATDVTVRNFLNMGENSRFEDYSDGVDTARTGCFAM